MRYRIINAKIRQSILCCTMLSANDNTSMRPLLNLSSNNFISLSTENYYSSAAKPNKLLPEYYSLVKYMQFNSNIATPDS